MMPRGVIPGSTPVLPGSGQGGQLPFISSAAVMQGDVVLAEDVPISVWPTPNSFTEVGVAYDHQGEAPVSFAAVFRTPNARVYVDDTRFTVVDWQRNDYLPHLALALREIAPML